MRLRDPTEVIEVIEVIEVAGGPVILMADAGTPPSFEGYTASLPEIGQALRALHTSYGLSPVSGLQPWDIGQMRARLERRGVHRHPPHIRDWFHTSLALIPDLPPGGSSVVHTDPHPGNWVRDTTGRLRLIDWESAMRSHPEMDLAGVVHSTMLHGTDPMPFLREYGNHDTEKLTAFLAVKILSAAAHLLWRKGPDEFTHRREVVIPKMRRLFEIPLAD